MTHLAHGQITDISVVNEHFVCIDFHTALGFTTSYFNNNICVSLFISLHCCCHNEIATVSIFSYLRAGGN